MPGPVAMFCSAISYTLCGKPDATVTFNASWEAVAPEDRPLLCYNSGRTVADMEGAIVDGTLPGADILIGSLIAAPDDHGRPAFVFDKGGAGRSGALIAGFALVLALGLAGLSAAGWFERGSEALAGEQAQLLAEGRSLRESTQLRAMAEPALAREAEAVRLGRLAATLEMLGETGKGGPLARLTLNGEALDLIPAGSGAAEQVALAAPDTGEAERGTGLDEPRAAGTQ